MKKKSLLLLAGVGFVACSSSTADAPVAPVDSGSAIDSGVIPDAPADVPADSDAAVGCSTPIANDGQKDMRSKCTFAAGAKVADTLGLSAADRAKIPISHVIVMMKENRSFDMYFGKLTKAGQTVEGIPADYSNPDPSGAQVKPFHQTNTCVKNDPAHQYVDMHNQYDGGKLDGFVKSAAATSDPASDGKYVLGYYEQTELPFYYWLAGTYAVADHYFASAMSGTWTNRLYLEAGNSYGVKSTAIDYSPTGMKSIFDELDAAKVTWGVYSDDTAPLDGSMIGTGWDSSHAGVGTTAMFLKKLADGTLPQVTFIDSLENDEDEHPPADLQKGEAWTKKIYDAVVNSPLWLDKDKKGVALIYTYDESGGFFDHVDPPKACPPTSDAKDAEWNQNGFRVPFVLISPYSRKGYVSHVNHEHTSITRFIEALYDLPAMTARDANVDALLDMFDFGCAPVDKPADAPAPGTGACK